MTFRIVPLKQKIRYASTTDGVKNSFTSIPIFEQYDVLEAVEGLKKDFVSKLAKHNLTDEQLILLIFHECVEARFGK